MVMAIKEVDLKKCKLDVNVTKCNVANCDY